MDETKNIKNDGAGLSRIREILLALVSAHCSPKTAAEIASLTGIPISSVIRLLGNLTQINWAAKIGDEYIIGTEITAISQAFIIAQFHALKQIKQDIYMTECHANDLLGNNKPKGDV